MTRVTDPAGRFATYTYDVAGNRTQMVDAVANLAANPALGTTDVVFDSLNRPVSTTYSDGTPTVSYSYDAQGRRSQMVDGPGTTTYGFDAADRVASVTRGADVFAYAYDLAGNVTSRTYPDGTVVAGTFDDAGQQVTTTEPAGTVSFAYDVAGNPITSTFPNGVTRTTSFDNASRISVVSNSSAAGVLSRFTYVRDANGNPTGVDYTNGAGLVPVESQRLTYDNADRLTKVCQTVTTCTTANQTVWTYDKNGNRLTEKAGAAAISTYSYDPADQLTAITGPGAKAFTYNANGDQITSGVDVSTFNAARQTTGTTVGGVATTFAYDGNGNRNTITTGGVATSELWDTVGGLPNLAVERSAAGVVQRRYSYGRGTETLGYTDPVAATQGWYLTDALGSVANITNSTGVSVATYTYNPFGVARVNTTSPGYAANPLKHTGQHLDPTGNYNLRARQYNPALGRFTQTDPLDPSLSGAASAYAYVGNNPARYTDPGGMRRGLTNTSAMGVQIGIPGTNKCINYRPGDKDGCTTRDQPKEKKPKKCKVSKDWKIPLLEDCKAAIFDYQRSDVIETLTDAQKAELLRVGLEYYDWFSDAKGCFAQGDPAACTDLLVSVAERVTSTSASATMALHPVALLLVKFNVAVTSSAVSGSSANAGAGLTPGATFRDFGGGVQTAQSPAGSVRLMQGVNSKLLVDCGDGF